MQIFNYNNFPVTFRDENGSIFVNATQMAKSFGKRPNDYLGLQSTIKPIIFRCEKNK